jgi:monofunctional biosynthetic peptidoglycan transglycosylase
MTTRWMLRKSAAWLSAALLATAGSASAEKVLVDFTRADEAEAWRIVNDGVMGGLSQSRMITASDSTASFAGTLSLENNGGFASVRRVLDARLPADTDAFVLQVRGDGRRYQLRLRTNDRIDGVAYRAEFTTVADAWMRIEIPLDAFQPTFRGRRVPDAPPLDPTRIRQVGLLLGDKRPGAFLLEVRDIRVGLDESAEVMEL